jgi:hypothetical protein
VTSRRIASLLLGLLGMLVGLAGPIALFFDYVARHADVMGSAWGRPLRVRGRILHPRLRAGSDWTRGARPVVADLDDPTRSALEALWLHDAQKEHASVPAFARISWLLVALGAPAELVEWAHRAALEEIDHARRCFALAAGYGRRSHDVEPMPDLLVGGLEMRGDPAARMAVESLIDGCLLEGFNADVAAACRAVCEEPVVRDVLARVATDERSHAAFSWALLEWLVTRGDPGLTGEITKAATSLGRIARPTAVSARNAALVALADDALMRAHGRIPDAAWEPLWRERVAETRSRVVELLERNRRRAAA